MTDPYKVLGVSPDATQEEISKAYKRLAKKYHPDLNPNDKNAAEQMSKINEAYNMLRSGKNGYGNYSSQNYSSQGSYGTGGYSGSYYSGASYGTVRSFIMNGRYYEALKALQAMDTRDPQWYYLSAVANYNLGNKAAAVEYASVAVKTDPSNIEYRDFYEKICASERYTQRTVHYGVPSGPLLARLAAVLCCCLSGGRFVPCFWC